MIETDASSRPKGRESIRKMVLRQTIYTEIQQNDFGYSLTDTAQMRIRDMVQYAFAEFHRLSSEIDRKLLKLLQEKIQRIYDIYERTVILGNINHMIETVKNSTDVITVSGLADRINTFVNELNLTLYSEGLLHMFRLDQNLKILKSIASSEITVPISEYKSKSLISTLDYIRREHDWSKFLVRVYEFFVEYEVQKDVTLYNVKQLEDWKKPKKIQGLNITEHNLQTFAKQFSSDEHIEVTDSKLNELNEIIKFTLQSTLTVECIADTLTIKGNFVKSSDIPNAKCSSSVSKIRVFAAVTFFVDSNLRMDKELDILANKWVVLDAFTFYLNGEDGEAMAKPDLPGTPGLPGNVGANGKNFFGFANAIIDGNLLTINTSGGNGGTGQDGTKNLDEIVGNFTTYHKESIGFFDDIHSFYEEYLRNHGNYRVELQIRGSSWRYFVILWAGFREVNSYYVYTKRWNICAMLYLGGQITN